MVIISNKRNKHYTFTFNNFNHLHQTYIFCHPLNVSHWSINSWVGPLDSKDEKVKVISPGYISLTRKPQLIIDILIS